MVKYLVKTREEIEELGGPSDAARKVVAHLATSTEGTDISARTLSNRMRDYAKSGQPLMVIPGARGLSDDRQPIGFVPSDNMLALLGMTEGEFCRFVLSGVLYLAPEAVESALEASAEVTEQ